MPGGRGYRLNLDYRIIPVIVKEVERTMTGAKWWFSRLANVLCKLGVDSCAYLEKEKRNRLRSTQLILSNPAPHML